MKKLYLLLTTILVTVITAISQESRILSSDELITLPDGQSVYCQKGTILTKNAKGQVISFVPVNPLILKSPNGTQIEVNPGDEVQLFDNGTLKSFTPTQSLTLKTGKGEQINIMPYQKVKLYQNGTLRSATVNDEITVQTGKNFKFLIVSRSKVEFDEKGNVISAFPKEPLTIDVNGTQVKCAPRKNIKFYSDGSLKSCIVLEQITLPDIKGGQQIVYPGQRIILTQDGKIRSIR